MSKKVIDTMHSEFQEQLGDQAATIKTLTSNSNTPNDAKVAFKSDDNIQQIPSPIQTLLDNYDTLDDNNEKSLFQLAMTTTNPVLQRAIIQLQESKTTHLTGLQAKLPKELITLAEKYKVPELQ
jgi:hypothetical protein